nr:hypothetical protein [Tolivirales sp.]
MAKQATKTKRTRRRAQSVSQTGIMPMSRFPGSGPMTPGRAMVRVAHPVYNDVTAHTLALSATPVGGITAFDTWFVQALALLANFKFWRVRSLSVEPMITGGAASKHSIVFNVSNTQDTDASISDLLNDDYAVMSTSLHMPKISPPRGYWDNGSRKWYNISGISAGVPDVSAGSINYYGNGGETAGTVVGYIVVSLEMEFHTLG